MRPRRPRPVRVMNSVLAGVQVLVAGTAFINLMPVEVYGLIALAFAAVQVGWGVYTEQQVTPLSDPRDNEGEPLVPAL